MLEGSNTLLIGLIKIRNFGLLSLVGILILIPFRFRHGGKQFLLLLKLFLSCSKPVIFFFQLLPFLTKLLEGTFYEDILSYSCGTFKGNALLANLLQLLLL